nr:hypothetical protein [Tanacetum cinerariifolium]
MIIDAVVDAAQVTTAIADILVSAVETIVTTTPTINAESTKINVEVTQAPKRKEVMIQELEETTTTKTTELVVKGSKKDEVTKSSLKRAREELEQENAKKQKMEDDKKSTELKQCLKIIPDDEDDVTIDATPLSSKSPTIVDYKTELVVKGSKKDEVTKSSLKRAREELEQENAKKQKMEDDKKSTELKQCLKIIPDDEDDVTIDATPLSSKSPTIVDYKIYKEGKKSYI